MSSTPHVPIETASADRRLRVMERFLTLEAGDLSAAMRQTAQLLAELFHADKVDVFFCTPDGRELVAEGTSDTPMGRLQQALGLDRLPVARGGRLAEVFKSGRSHRSDDANEDPIELREIVEDLGVRSALSVPIDVSGARRGVLLVSSATPGAFNDSDLSFLEVIGRWLGVTATRLTQAQMLAAQAAAAGMQEPLTASELTARQLEVAALVRRGLTNAEIANRLVVGSGTVANHVANILERLGFRSRSQLAAWAAERRIGHDGVDAAGDHDDD